MNVYLTANIGKQKDNKSNVLKRAWYLYRLSDMNWQESVKTAWKEAKLGIITQSFWTDADAEDVAWTIHSCVKNGVVNPDILMQWDSNKRILELDWVSYHLRRNGFEISETKNGSYDYVEHDNLPTL